MELVESSECGLGNLEHGPTPMRRVRAECCPPPLTPMVLPRCWGRPGPWVPPAPQRGCGGNRAGAAPSFAHPAPVYQHSWPCVS